MTGSGREKKRILLVDDSEDERDLVEFILTDYKFVMARDLAEGLRLARQGYFDLYILDNWLPDGSGVDLCRHIRDFDPYTPILFYSAACYPNNVLEALDAGAQAYIIKPDKNDELERTVARLVSVAVETVFEAQQAEFTAIQEELAIRQRGNAYRIGEAKKKNLRAKEKALRLRAEFAFLTAGGARGDFARRWPSVFSEEVHNHRCGIDKRNSVLLVDDDDDMRSIYGFIMANAGFRVKAVKNGFEALAEMQESLPDVVVTDLAMPVVDGITLIEIIKSRAEFADIPIIAMTAYGQKSQKRAMSAGANIAVGKPTDFRSICELVTRVLLQG